MRAGLGAFLGPAVSPAWQHKAGHKLFEQMGGKKVKEILSESDLLRSGEEEEEKVMRR